MVHKDKDEIIICRGWSLIYNGIGKEAPLFCSAILYAIRCFSCSPPHPSSAYLILPHPFACMAQNGEIQKLAHRKSRTHGQGKRGEGRGGEHVYIIEKKEKMPRRKRRAITRHWGRRKSLLPFPSFPSLSLTSLPSSMPLLLLLSLAWALVQSVFFRRSIHPG